MSVIRLLALSVLLVPPAAAQTRAELLEAARAFPPMPQSTVQMSILLGRPATFASGAPFNDLEFTAFDTDYMDGENSGYDLFLPVDPGRPNPGSDRIRYVRTVLNSDLDAAYGAARGARIVLGTHEIPEPFFLRGPNGIDDDYLVVQNFDYARGHLQLRGPLSDYRLLTATTAEGVATTGTYLFHVGAGVPDLVAFVFPCDVLGATISGNPPQNPLALCNASRAFRLDDPAQVRLAQPLATAVAVPQGIAQVGTPGREIASSLTVDAEGHVYLVGLTDGDLGGAGAADNAVFVARIAPDGRRVWTTTLPTREGTILKAAVTDDAHVYVAGRTLGALPGFTNAGMWDGILLKLRRADGAIVATDQYGTAGIDGYGNLALDDAGALFVSAQGSAPDSPGGTDRNYLVAKHDRATLANVWRAIEPPAQNTVASAEAWGGLTYVPGASPGDGRLAAAGWYFAPRGADAFVAVYENLTAATPVRAHVRVITTPGTTADWVLANTVGPDGSVYVAGYTTGALGGPHRGEGDAYVMRLSPALETLATAQFGTARSEFARSLVWAPDGTLLAVGTTHGSLFGPNADLAEASGDVFVARFAPDLTALGGVQFGTPHEDRGVGVVWNDVLIVGGTTEGSLAGPSAGSLDGYAVALDARTLAFVNYMAVSAEARPVLRPRIALGPNPTAGPLRLAGASADRIVVSDLLGRVVHTAGPVADGGTLSLSRLPAGVYFVRVDTRGETAVLRIVKL